MNISPSKAKKTALRLRRENRHGRSWRTISREDYAGNVKPGTLNRIANTKGIWLPKDKEILLALGLIKPRKPRIVRKIEEYNMDELIEARHRAAMRLEYIEQLIEGQPT